MIDTMGIIMTGLEDDALLGELTMHRPVAALPVCGRYRLIDFILSNMVNSGISRVGVTTHSNYRSLMDHLGSGKEWDLNRKKDGLSILPPYITGMQQAVNNGTLHVLNGIMDFLYHSSQRYVVLAGSNLLFNTTFYELREAHIKSGADVTILYHRPFGAGAYPPKHVSLITDENGRVTDIESGYAGMSSGKLSMGVYFMEKSFLEYQIRRCLARGQSDFVMDVLIRNLSILKIHAVPFNGYVGRVDSVSSFFRENYALLDPNICRELFNSKHPIYTKVKDQVPTIYGSNAKVKNSLVADGCFIDGTVENSVLFRGVRVEEGATVTNSILNQNSYIQTNVTLDYVVLDKNVVVRYGKRLMGQESHPVVVAKGMVV